MDAGRTDTARAMQQQNIRTIRALHGDAKQGGQNVFLYLERDRNTEGMGIPEPAAAGVLEVMEKANPGLHVLPMHISGAETIFPTRRGINEIDVFMDNIKIGQGDVTCGKPVPFARVLEAVRAVDQREVVSSVWGANEQLIDNPKQRRLATTAVAILSLVADLAPTEDDKGVYRQAPKPQEYGLK